MSKFLVELQFQAGLIRTYIFRKLFKKEAQLIDRLMRDNDQLTEIATDQVQTIFDLNSKVISLEYQLEDAEVKKEYYENLASNLEDELNTLEGKLLETRDRVEELENEIASLEYMREE